MDRYDRAVQAHRFDLRGHDDFYRLFVRPVSQLVGGLANGSRECAPDDKLRVIRPQKVGYACRLTHPRVLLRLTH